MLKKNNMNFGLETPTECLNYLAKGLNLYTQ